MTDENTYEVDVAFSGGIKAFVITPREEAGQLIFSVAHSGEEYGVLLMDGDEQWHWRDSNNSTEEAEVIGRAIEAHDD